MNRVVTVLVACLSVAPAAAAAQETGSQANLVFGVALSFTGNTDLWSVPNQPLQLNPGVADTLALTRSVTGGLGLMFYGIYFPKPNLGLSGEVFFTGTNYDDTCKIAFSTGDQDVATACGDIDGDSNGTSTVQITAGAMWRISPRGSVSPYVRAGLGVAIINRSSVAMEGRTGNGVVQVYVDDDARSLSPTAVLGAGFTAGTKRGGYQIRFEVRDNIVGYDAVTMASNRAGIKPPSEAKYQHLFSVQIGFEIVLEKSRGRRY
jgi:hypothetical protein